MKILIHTYSRCITAADTLYQRALRYTGISDCTEMRVTAGVAVCVVIYYFLCFGVWIANLFSHTEAFTALAQ